MLEYLWFCRVFLLTICVHVTLSSYQATGSFWVNPATREEAHEFFERYNIKPRPRLPQEVITVNGTVRRLRRPSGGTSQSGRTSSHRASSSRASRVSSHTTSSSRASTSGPTGERTSFSELSDDDKFKHLTGNLFDKSKFTDRTNTDVEVQQAEPVADREDIIFKGQTKTVLNLPGTDMTFMGDFVRLGDSDATMFKNVEISMVGKLSVHVGGRGRRSPFSWDVEIHKPVEKEEYEILKFHPAQRVMELSQMFKNVIDTIQSFTDGKIDTSILDLINKQSSTVTATGSFSQGQSELIITADAENELTKQIGATGVHLIRTYEENGNNRFSILISFDALTQITSWLGYADLFTQNEWLNGIAGKACLFLVSSQTTYLDHTKTTLQDCFGAQDLQAEKETFKTLGQGIHGYLMVDFSGVLDKCWEDPTTGNARTDKPTEEIEKMHKEINLYGKIAKDTAGKWRMAIKFLNELQMSVKAFRGCIDGVKRNMPAFLSDNRVVLRHLSKDGDNIFQIAFAIIASDDVSKKFVIPFTNIELSSLEFSASNKPEEDAPSTTTPTWTFNGSVALVLYGSDVSVTFHHSQGKTQVIIASTTFRIGDVIKAFNIPLDDESVLNTMGVSNFNLEMSFERVNGGGKDFSVKIRGTPVFADFDDLHLSAIFLKKKGSLRFAVGLYLNGADFTPIMKNIFKRNDISMAWLADLQIVIVFNKLDSDVKLVDAASLSDESDEESGEGEKGEKKLQKNVKSMSGKIKRGKNRGGKTKLAKEKVEKLKLEKAKVERENVIKLKVEKAKLKTESRKTKSGKGKRAKPKSGKQVRTIVTTKEVIEKINNVNNVTKELESGQNVTTQPTARGEGDEKGDDDDSDEEGDDDDEGPQLVFQDLAASPLDGKTLSSGIHLTIAWTLPTTEDKCSGSTLCTWIVNNLVKDKSNPPVVSISASFDGTSFSLAASFNGRYEIAQYLEFTGITLEFAVGLETKLQLSATLEYADPQLTPGSKLILGGAIKATPASLTLEFSMQGLVRVSDYVEIGNMQLGGGLSAGLPAFLFGITLNLGHKEGKLISIRGSVRVDVGNPRNNYIYASINSLTVKRVCEAFHFDCTHVIDPIKNTGFPNGVTFSYSPEGVDGSELGSDKYADIPQGIFIEGTFNLLGFEPYAKLVVSTDGFEIDIRLSPINWAFGMIQLYKEEGNTEEGPQGMAKLSDNRFEFKLKSYSRLLWIIWNEADIEISNEYVKFHVEGTIIPAILEGEIHFEAGLKNEGNSNNNPLFDFWVIVNTARLKDIIKSTVETVVGALRFVVQNLEELIDTVVDAAKNALKKIEDVCKGWKRDVDNWKTRLEARKQRLESESASQDDKCPHCKDICVPFLDWSSKCWKVWGYWVGCPYWNSCFTKITDPICYMSCLLTRTLRTLERWANQAILTIERLVASGVEGLLSLFGRVLEFAEETLQSAKEFKERTFSKIPRILRMKDEQFDSKLAEFGINHMKLSATLSASYKSCVGYEYDVTWFGSTYAGEGEACLDAVQFVNTMVNAIMEGNSVSRGTSKASETINEAEKEAGEHQRAVDEVVQEIAKTDAKVKNDVQMDISDVSSAERRDDIPTLKRIAASLENIPRASIAPTEKEMEYIKLSEKEIKKYDVRGDPYVRSITDESPWKLPNQQYTVGHNETVRRDDDAIEKRTLDFDTQLTSCGRIKRVLDGYSQLTDGLLEYSNAVEKTSRDMERTRIKNNHKLQKFRRDVEIAVSQHNMSGADAADVYFLYHKLADRHEELEKRSIIAVQREDAYAVPLIRRQLNDLLGHETGDTFIKYTEVMHNNAVEGYKRSIIPTPNDVKGEQILENIKKELQSIVTNENSRLTPMRSRLIAVKRNIITMSELAKKCRQK